MTNFQPQRVITLSVMIGVVMGLMLLVFDVFEANTGHSIAVAAFAATTIIIFLDPQNKSAKPSVIFIAYFSAASLGYLSSVLPLPIYLQASIAVSATVFVLLRFLAPHPPALAYAFGFILGGYGLTELVLTIPALLAYFITIGTVVQFGIIVLGYLGLVSDDNARRSEKLNLEKIVNRILPYALIVLFISLLFEFLRPDLTEPYRLYLTVLDAMIITVFVIELYYKYKRAKSIKLFAKENWIDILAVIPFFLVMRFIQGVSLVVGLVAGQAHALADMTKFTKFLRPIARSPRFARMVDQFNKLENV